MFSPYNYKYLIKLYHATKITVVPHQATGNHNCIDIETNSLLRSMSYKPMQY